MLSYSAKLCQAYFPQNRQFLAIEIFESRTLSKRLRMVIFTLYYKAPIFYMTLALITSTALGMLPHYVGVGKSHLMGVLIVPAIVIYMQMFI